MVTTRTDTVSALPKLLVAFTLFLTLPVWVVHAQEPREHLRDSELLTGQQMRFAFRDVVRQSTDWTVGILSEGKTVALGTIVGSEGWILTKSSQTNKANQVQLADGRQFPIQSRSSHQGLDLALLKVDAEHLPVVVWEKQAPELGAWMVTPGNGASEAVIAIGVLSVPRRSIPRSSAHGYLGVELAREELPRIKRVFPNSGAFNAGLQEGDVVLMIDEHPISTAEQLVRTLRDYRPGDTLSLRVRRSEEEMACSVTLMHPYGDFLSRIAFQNQMGGELSFRRDNFEAVYQHDSVLTPQDCGGPVVNLEGLAVGVNIARAGRTESYAIPADLIEDIVDEMKANLAATSTLSE